MLGIGLVIAPISLLLPFIGAPIPGPVVGVAYGIVIFKVGFDSVTMMSFRQQVTPTELMGRVNGSMRVCFSGAVVLGSAAAGVLATFGERSALSAASIALALVWIPIAFSPLRKAKSLSDYPA